MFRISRITPIMFAGNMLSLDWVCMEGKETKRKKRKKKKGWSYSLAGQSNARAASEPKGIEVGGVWVWATPTPESKNMDCIYLESSDDALVAVVCSNNHHSQIVASWHVGGDGPVLE